MKGNLEMVRRILDLNPEVNASDVYGQTPLVKAIQGGHLGCINMLIKEGADPNSHDKYGNTPMHQAVKYGRLDIIELILRSGANINTYNIVSCVIYPKLFRNLSRTAQLLYIWP